jgi:hypothetical protein
MAAAGPDHISSQPLQATLRLSPVSQPLVCTQQQQGLAPLGGQPACRLLLPEAASHGMLAALHAGAAQQQHPVLWPDLGAVMVGAGQAALPAVPPGVMYAAPAAAGKQWGVVMV